MDQGFWKCCILKLLQRWCNVNGISGAVWRCFFITHSCTFAVCLNTALEDVCLFISDACNSKCVKAVNQVCCQHYANHPNLDFRPGDKICSKKNVDIELRGGKAETKKRIFWNDFTVLPLSNFVCVIVSFIKDKLSNAYLSIFLIMFWAILY